MLMLDNVDVGIIINLDFDEEGNRYIVFKLDKMRDKTMRTYIAQPFIYGSTIRLMEDVGGIPMFKETLHMNMEVPRIASIRTSSANVMANIDMVTSSHPPKDNIFKAGPVIDIPNDDDFGEIVDEIPEIKKPRLFRPIFFTKPPVNKPTMESIEKLKKSLAS